jgi:hypothetical protein
MINLKSLEEIELECSEKGFKPLWTLFNYFNKNSTVLTNKDKDFFIEKFNISEVYLNSQIRQIGESKQNYFKEKMKEYDMEENLEQIFSKGIYPKDFIRNLNED